MGKAVLLCVLCVLCTVCCETTHNYTDEQLLESVLRSRNAAIAKAAEFPVDPWDVFRAAIDASVFPDLVATVGNESGRVFTYFKGRYTLETQLPTASAGKWPSGVTIMALIASGTTSLTLDTRAYELLGYWTRDENDPRSRVTVRHALSFTTGFEAFSCPAGSNLQQCAESNYRSAPHTAEPGTRKNYGAGHVHLAVAGAMAEVASGRRFVELFDEYVGLAVPMPNTRYTNLINPGLAGGMVSTSADYSNFLTSYFHGRVISAEDRIEMERDQFPDAVRDSFSAGVGHYGFCNWYECLEEGRDNNGMTEVCRRRQEHGSAGAFGWWPGHNALHKYWYQWMVFDSSTTSGAYRVQWVPLITAIVTGEDLTNPNIFPPEPTLAEIAKWRKLQPLIHPELL